jgi:hypothetical protein
MDTLRALVDKLSPDPRAGSNKHGRKCASRDRVALWCSLVAII